MNETFLLDLDATIRQEFQERQITLEDEIARDRSELGVTYGALKGKDLVPIITATAGLAPLVVPVLTTIIRRLFPYREIQIEVEEFGENKKKVTVRVKES